MIWQAFRERDSERYRDAASGTRTGIQVGIKNSHRLARMLREARISDPALS
jgi:hypothetical protein